MKRETKKKKKSLFNSLTQRSAEKINARARARLTQINKFRDARRALPIAQNFAIAIASCNQARGDQRDGAQHAPPPIGTRCHRDKGARGRMCAPVGRNEKSEGECGTVCISLIYSSQADVARAPRVASSWFLLIIMFVISFCKRKREKAKV